MTDHPEQRKFSRPEADAPGPDSRDSARAAYEEHGRLLYSLALAECRDPGLAEDAVQEAFLRYQEALQAGSEIRSVRAWLARVAVNFLRDAARRGARQEALSAVSAVAAPPPAGSADELDARLRALLTPRELQCVQLRVLGYKYLEIAEILGLRPGSVARLLSRAQVKLEKLRGPRDGG
jgi:RNA polymerase sigma-70 factor (ECF subfamily)